MLSYTDSIVIFGLDKELSEADSLDELIKAAMERF